jgi:Bacterial dnaA protein helix-turn-helix
VSDDAFAALVAEAEALKAKLKAERGQLLERIGQIDVELHRISAFINPRAIELTPLPEAERRFVPPEQVGRRGQPLNARDLMHAVALWYGITISTLISRDRHASLARARHVAAWVVRKYTRPQLSYPEIGRAMGMRDHTTIIASYNAVEELREKDELFNAEMSEMEQLIEQAKAMRAPQLLALPSSQTGAIAYTEPGDREGRKAAGDGTGNGTAPAALAEREGTGSAAEGHRRQQHRARH